MEKKPKSIKNRSLRVYAPPTSSPELEANSPSPEPFIPRPIVYTGVAPGAWGIIFRPYTFNKAAVRVIPVPSPYHPSDITWSHPLWSAMHYTLYLVGGNFLGVQRVDGTPGSQLVLVFGRLRTVGCCWGVRSCSSIRFFLYHSLCTVKQFSLRLSRLPSLAGVVIPGFVFLLTQTSNYRKQ